MLAEMMWPAAAQHFVVSTIAVTKVPDASKVFLLSECHQHQATAVLTILHVEVSFLSEHAG